MPRVIEYWASVRPDLGAQVARQLNGRRRATVMTAVTTAAEDRLASPDTYLPAPAFRDGR
jgi:hypothetical protein